MDETQNRTDKLEQLHKLRSEISRLEDEIYGAEAGERPANAPHANPGTWRPQEFYLAYHLIAGFIIGSLGALASLMLNIIGAAMVGLFPLKLIRVYLTFPLGEKALELNSGLALGIGCSLYLVTGALYGMVFHYVLSRHYANSPFKTKLALATGMALILWVVNFYGILSWLQPMLFGGNWIISDIPFYVAAATHLVFGWSVVLLGTMGHFDDQWSASLNPA